MGVVHDGDGGSPPFWTTNNGTSIMPARPSGQFGTWHDQRHEQLRIFGAGIVSARAANRIPMAKLYLRKIWHLWTWSPADCSTTGCGDDDSSLWWWKTVVKPRHDWVVEDDVPNLVVEDQIDTQEYRTRSPFKLSILIRHGLHVSFLEFLLWFILC